MQRIYYFQVIKVVQISEITINTNIHVWLILTRHLHKEKQIDDVIYICKGNFMIMKTMLDSKQELNISLCNCKLYHAYESWNSEVDRTSCIENRELPSRLESDTK